MDEKLDEQLNDYLDGELNDADRAAFEARLEHDPELKREFEALRELVQAARALPKTAQPERDLWAGIEKRIADEADTGGVIRFGGAQRRAAAGSLWPLGVAAAAVMAFLLGAQYLKSTESADDTAYPVTYVSEPDERVLALTAEYDEARSELAELLEERRDRLPAETLAVLENNLAIIEDAVVDITRALEEYPEDPKLRGMLREAHRREVRVLQQAVQLPNEES